MATDLPLKLEGTSLPPQVRWSPQALANFIWDKARIVTNGSYSLFAAGSTEPSSNVGPWFNGQSWFYWSNVTGNYQPIILAPESLGYWIGPDAPDPNVFSFWISTTAGGSPLALNIFYSGAWVDVYAAQLASYAPLASPTFTGTPAAPTAAPGTNTTQLATTAFVEAAVGAIPPPTSFDSYPAQGVATAQVILVDTNPYKLAFTVAPINPAPAPFDTTNRRYIAPADGIYLVSVATQFDNGTAVAAGMEVGVSLYKNGVFLGNGMADLDDTPSPNGDRWSPGFSGLVALSTNDYLEVFATLSDGVNTGNATVTVAQFSISRVSA